MLDKKKIVALAGFALAVIIVLVTAIIAMTGSGGNSKANNTPAAQESSSAPATPSPSPSAALALEEQDLLIRAANAAASYAGPKSGTAPWKPADYMKYRFAENLAETYTPIWYGVFAGRTDQEGVIVHGQAGGEGSSPSTYVRVLDFSGDHPGAYVLRVAVDVNWSTEGVKPAPGKKNPKGGKATWTLTYDQLSQRVVKIEQPAWQELDAASLFDALALPVPTTQPKK